MADKEIGSLASAGALDGTELAHVVQGGNSRQADLASIAALARWELADTWTFSSAVANVDITDLGSYKDLMIIARGVSLSVSGSLVMRFSTNNGSSFFSGSGDYAFGDIDGVEVTAGFTSMWKAASTAARNAIAQILAVNVDGAPKVINRITRAADGHAIFIGSTSPVNALRFLGSGGGNLTAGTIYVLGRK